MNQNNPFLTVLCARIKATMQRKQITQAQLAQMMIRDESWVSRALTGHLNLCLSSIRLFEIALDETFIQVTPLQP